MARAVFRSDPDALRVDYTRLARSRDGRAGATKPMTRIELLQLVVAQARSNGFQFRRWFTTRLGVEWTSSRDAVALLNQQRRYYALLFSPEFATAFWRAGASMTLHVDRQSFQRRGADGNVLTVNRKPYTRRRLREHSWKYHLKHMAVSEEPLRYVRRFVRAEEELFLPGDETREQPIAVEQIVVVDDEDLLPDDE